MKWFVEQKAATSSHWMPVLYRDRPEIDRNMRIKMTGIRVRKHPVEIADEDHGMSLYAMQKKYGGGND